MGCASRGLGRHGCTMGDLPTARLARYRAPDLPIPLLVGRERPCNMVNKQSLKEALTRPFLPGRNVPGRLVFIGISPNLFVDPRANCLTKLSRF